MAQNKNAQIRYKALDRCFANQLRKFYIDDLIAYCGQVLSDHYGCETTVSRRQIINDMDFMKSNAGFDAPIESCPDGKKVFYRYADPDFSILKAPLNPSELASLKEALETLSRMNNLPGADWVSTIKAKLSSGITKTIDQRQVISFEENEFLKGIEFLNPLYQNIINTQCLDITYQGFFAPEQNVFTVSPYYLKQYNNRWFLFGYNHKVQKIQNLALDRIIDAVGCTTVYQPCDVDFDEYFEDIIGVTNDLNAPVENISIELSDNIVPYVRSKPLHGSQKIAGNILTLELKLNYELEALILSYGENMKVMAPDKLVTSIKQRIIKINEMY